MSDPTNTAEEVLELFEEHRDTVEIRQTSVGQVKREEVVAFVPMDRMGSPKGLPNVFHELAEEHHIRIVDAMVLPPASGDTLADSVGNPLDKRALAVFVWPEGRPPADHYHEHWEGVPAPIE